MAQRPVFYTRNIAPYYGISQVDFVYNSGFAPSQKRKNINAIHEAYRRANPGKNILEISSKSTQPGGVALSAFNLKTFVPSIGKAVPVECAYQAGKVFRNGGPYLDLLEATPRDAKRDERLKTSGELVGFRFEGRDFPLVPATFFYNHLYIRALMDNPELAQTVLENDAFTDIEFNPGKSLACQARAAAIYTGLVRTGQLSGDLYEILKTIR